MLFITLCINHIIKCNNISVNVFSKRDGHVSIGAKTHKQSKLLAKSVFFISLCINHQVNIHVTCNSFLVSAFAKYMLS